MFFSTVLKYNIISLYWILYHDIQCLHTLMSFQNTDVQYCIYEKKLQLGDIYWFITIFRSDFFDLKVNLVEIL